MLCFRSSRSLIENESEYPYRTIAEFLQHKIALELSQRMGSRKPVNVAFEKSINLR